MDLNSLTLLVEIIDSGNLSQAARKLKMTRANVSYHLTQLEKSVGCSWCGAPRGAWSRPRWGCGCTSMAARSRTR